MTKVVAVIVTYNRLEKLKHTLSCFDDQTESFFALVVVNNRSTDGTDAYLQEWENKPSQFAKHVIILASNTGGSGGFYEGEKYALTLNPDWVYVADDDAYPHADMMSRFYEFEKLHHDEKLSAICSVVLFPDETINTGTRARSAIEDNVYRTKDVSVEEYQQSYFEHNTLSYVGAFLSAGALKEVGLVNKDFFIYQDDCEHSIRLSRYGKMLCCPKIEVTHDEPRIQSAEAIMKGLWKNYYAYRNRTYMLIMHHPKAAKRHIIDSLLEIKARKESSISADGKMRFEGIYDAVVGNLGLHHMYRPGLIVDENIKLPYHKFIWNIVYVVVRFIHLFDMK